MADHSQTLSNRVAGFQTLLQSKQSEIWAHLQMGNQARVEELRLELHTLLDEWVDATAAYMKDALSK